MKNIKKLILVVGMDNTGKTTLANNLAKELILEKNNFNYSIIKNLNKEEWLKLFKNKIYKKEISLFERFTPIEELVYGSILRKYSKFEVEEVFNILKNYNIFLIYCRPSIENIFNWKNREQMEGVIENKEFLLNRFDNIINAICDTFNNQRKKFKFYKYDYTNEKSFSILLAELKKFKGE